MERHRFSVPVAVKSACPRAVGVRTAGATGLDLKQMASTSAARTIVGGRAFDTKQAAGWSREHHSFVSQDKVHRMVAPQRVPQDHATLTDVFHLRPIGVGPHGCIKQTEHSVEITGPKDAAQVPLPVRSSRSLAFLFHPLLKFSQERCHGSEGGPVGALGV